jgi:hypothetical protein
MLLSITQATTNAGKDAGQKEHLSIAMRAIE